MIRTLTLSLLASGAVFAGDWPQFLGAARDSHAADGAVVAADFPGGEPEVLWSVPVGSGYSGPAVVGDAVFVFHRLGDMAVLQDLAAADGKERWRFEYKTDYRDDFNFDDGPRAVPLVADGKVFVFGAEGMLHCVNAGDGKVLWKKDTSAEWPSDKGFFGRACSPMIADGVLILQIGGKGGAGIVGLDPATGELKWKATNHEAGYASPVAFGGNVACFTRDGFVLLEPVSGKVLLEKKHRSGMNASVNAASPVVVGGDRVFLSACYDVGAVLWKVAEKVDEVWAKEGAMDCHFGTPVLVKDMLYGFHGRQEQGAEFRCVNVSDGAVVWASPVIGTGHVIAAGETLVVQ